MPGALVQLIAYGAQDVYLTGDPTFTYFKSRASRSTNFAVESIEQTINGSTTDGQTTIQISRNGDLIYGVWLEVTLVKNGSSFYPAEQFVKSVELEIGGQRIDYIDSDWMAIRRELFLTSDQRDGYYEMNNFRLDDADGMAKKFYVNIPFFFTEGDVTKALPLIALQYHEIKLNITFSSNIPGISTTVTPKVRAFVDYVFLDTRERQLFAQNPHEYIIEQLQIQTAATPLSSGVKSARIQLNFNHPVRYLLWANRTNVHGAFSASQLPFEANDNYAPYSSCKLQLNGTDRFQERDGSYFRLVQPYIVLGKTPSAGIYMYSFGLDNTTNKNTGTLNFSRIDNATLVLSTKAATALSVSSVTDTSVTTVSGLTAFIGGKIFARNYNVLRIQSGMGGLAYSS